MRVGIFAGDVIGSWSIEQIVESAIGVERDGLDSFWLPNVFGLDALTALSVVGREVDRIELGTNVIPIYSRHPLALAQQALSTQVLAGGRLTLGVGLSHRFVIEGAFGLSYDRPARYMREYLSALAPLLSGSPVSFQGDVLRASGSLRIAGTSPVPILVAAMGPRMLSVAGTLSDGTLLAWTGPNTIRSYVAPAVRKAADAAGRPRPRIGTALPVCVTDDSVRARERARRLFGGYDEIPSYRSMLDREGVATVGDLAMIGAEDEVGDQIERLVEAGVTDLTAVEFDRDEDVRARTRAVLGRYAGAA